MNRCLIVDDEEPARELIKMHLANFKDFEIVASLDNALEAFAFLQTHQVDLVFLDITMPKLSGIELLRSLKSFPKVILTTAYREHAVEAFELEVFDYLVKPITQERFMKAIAKFLHHRNNEPLETPQKDDEAYMYFKTGRDQIKLFLKDILFMEALAGYIKLHTKSRYFIVSETLIKMEERLPLNLFARIHKSFIISLDKVTSYNADEVMLDDKALPLGRLFKTGFVKAIQARLKA